MKPTKAVKPLPGTLGPKPLPKPKPAYLTGIQEGPSSHGNRIHGKAAVWSPSGLCYCYTCTQQFTCPFPTLLFVINIVFVTCYQYCRCYLLSLFALLLYTNIDLKLRNQLQGPLHCKIGVTCVYNEHLFYTLL